MKLQPVYAIADANGNVEEVVDGSLEQTVEKALSLYGRHTPVYFNGDVEQLQKEGLHRKTVQRSAAGVGGGEGGRADNPIRSARTYGQLLGGSGARSGSYFMADEQLRILGPKFWDDAARGPRVYTVAEVFGLYPDDKVGLKKAWAKLRPYFPERGDVKVLSASYGDAGGRSSRAGRSKRGAAMGEGEPLTGSAEDIAQHARKVFKIEKPIQRVSEHGGEIEVQFSSMTLHIDRSSGGSYTTGIVGGSYDTPAGLSDALLVSNAKTEKAVEGVDTALQHIPPSLSKGLAFLPFSMVNSVIKDKAVRQLHGLPTLPALGVCIGSSAECRKSCLVWAGQNQAVAHNNIVKGMRLGALLSEPAAFIRMTIDSIRKHIKACEKAGQVPYFRPNILSDLPWELFFPDLWRVFPELAVYDYTKEPNRETRHLGHLDWRAKGATENALRYDLTFSFAGDNMPDVRDELSAGRRVAVVFLRGLKHGTKGEKGYVAPEPFPERFLGQEVIDGDAHDLRPLDPQGTVVGLRFKSLRGALSGQRGEQIRRAGSFVVAAPKHDPKQIVEIFVDDHGNLITAVTPVQNTDLGVISGMAAELPVALETDVATGLLSHGPIGLVAVIALYFAWTKDKEVKALNDARIAESRAATDKLLDVVGKVYASVDQLSTVADKLLEIRRDGK